jgi:small subunit ribosomal protein S21
VDAAVVPGVAVGNAVVRWPVAPFAFHLVPVPRHPRRGRSSPTGASVLSEVIIHEDENFERALKRFKKKCEKAGILSDLRKHRHYEKPSERRKRKMNAAVRKNRRTRHG